MFESTPMHIDTHAHVFEPGLPTVARARYVPDYAARLADYLRQLDGNDMARGVLVQPSFLGHDNAYLLEALAQAPQRLRGVIVVGDARLDAELSAERIAELDAKGVRGIRLNLIGAPLPSLGDPPRRRAPDRLAERGWPLEIHAAAGQWLELEPALADWASPVVIDPLGLPPAEAPEARDVVLRLAALGHVWIKVSGFYRSAPGQAATMVAALRTAGLVDRLVFGSDWPFTRFEEQRYGELKSHIVQALGDDADRVLGLNAQRLLRWEAEPSIEPPR